MPVWRAERTIEVSGDVTVVIDADDYRTDGLDADADGDSNVEELSAGSDPSSASSIPPDESIGAEFAGEWIGAVVYTEASDTFTFRSCSSVDTLVEELDGIGRTGRRKGGSPARGGFLAVATAERHVRPA